MARSIENQINQLILSAVFLSVSRRMYLRVICPRLIRLYQSPIDAIEACMTRVKKKQLHIRAIIFSNPTHVLILKPNDIKGCCLGDSSELKLKKTIKPLRLFMIIITHCFAASSKGFGNLRFLLLVLKEVDHSYELRFLQAL